MPKKKSFNPFKMGGSYVGALIGLIAPMLSIGHDTFIWSLNPFALSLGKSADAGTGIVFILAFIWWIIIGFLIGWGIHSIVRASR